MTTNQRISLMADLWPNACAAKGWHKNDRAKRLEVCSEAVGRALKSTSDLNNTSDFGKVKNHLLMLADNLRGAVETVQPEMDAARRYRYVIRTVVLPCLMLYVGDSRTYMASIIRDKFKRGSRVMPLALDDLNAAQLRQLLATLQRAVQTHRSENGDSVHVMKTRAGVPCDCAQCTKPKPKVFAMPAPEPVLAENEPF